CHGPSADARRTHLRAGYAGFWTNSQQKTPIPAPAAISASLLHLAETLERNLSKNALATYLAVLVDLSQAQIVLAFPAPRWSATTFPPRPCSRVSPPSVSPSPSKPRRSYSASWWRCVDRMDRS